MAFVITVLLITTAAAIVQGSLGLGLGLVASPGLILVDPGFVPLPLLTAALIASLWTCWRDRQAGIADKFIWTLVGIPVGIPIGILLLKILPPSILMLGLGLMVLVMAPAAAFAKSGIRPTGVHLGVGSLFSAVAGATVALPGPTVALVYNQLPPALLRMTMAVYLSIVQTIAIAALLFSGAAHGNAIMLIALTVPGTVIGLAVSGPVARWMNPRVARAAVVVVCIGAGASLTIKALLQMYPHTA
ncbi:TSUP family transporter [Rhodococcus opacus]|uniref:TSUP family transporter n=1 Tax=Rhodococcus opacus TaxID=37919 RepID=UPI002235BB26|nr:TSUP family transporter [Rhodococcus opacus]UZG60359.1 TSUP family transporter [Rhodococcus opacus]